MDCNHCLAVRRFRIAKPRRYSSIALEKKENLYLCKSCPSPRNGVWPVMHTVNHHHTNVMRRYHNNMSHHLYPGNTVIIASLVGYASPGNTHLRMHEGCLG